MYKQGKSIGDKAFLMAAIVATGLTILMGMLEFNSLRDRIETIILPSVNSKINDIAYDTKTHVEYLQFNTVHNYRNSVLSNSLAKEQRASCLTDITPLGSDGEYGINRKDDYYGSSKKNGLLIGKGEYQKYPESELVRFCSLIRSSLDNSELIRLTETTTELPSTFYYSSKREDYLLFFDTFFSSETMSKFVDPFIKSDYQRVRNKGETYWISQSHTSNFTGISSLSFVKNIRDSNNNVVGFLVRDLSVKDLTDFLTADIYHNKDDNLNLSQYGTLRIFNRNDEIYNSNNASNTNDITAQDATTVATANEEGMVINSINTMPSQPSFGSISSSLTIPYPEFILMVFTKNTYLLFLLGLMVMFFYIVFSQIIKGKNEGDKQYYDTLSNVYNRTGLREKVFKRIKKELAAGKTAHLFTVDANKFKYINDKYGHDVGDKAIQTICDAIRHVNRPEDDIVRLGGDEFLIVLYINNEIVLDHVDYMARINKKIAYDCKVRALPHFSVSAGYGEFNEQTSYSIEAAIKKADDLLMTKKSFDKMATITEDFHKYNIDITEKEVGPILRMSKFLNFIDAEHRLQKEVNTDVSLAYHRDLNYLISNYFQLIYPANESEDSRKDLHAFRLKIVDSHYQNNVSMSVFYFLFIKYQGFLFQNVELSQEEKMTHYRITAYELHFISSLKIR